MSDAERKQWNAEMKQWNTHFENEYRQAMKTKGWNDEKIENGIQKGRHLL